MSDLIKIVRTYRLTPGLADRLRLAEEILAVIASPLHHFVFSAIRPPAGDDVSQEILKALIVSLQKFSGDSEKSFWAWCFAIARNKLNDHYRKQASDPSLAFPPDELGRLVEASAQTVPISAADRHDLEYAMDLLAISKPECRDYLWKHYVVGLDYAEIAEDQGLNYDNVRMKIGRCLETAKSLVA